MTDNLLKSQAFKLKGRFYTFTVLQLLDVDIKHFEQYLSEVVATAPRLFDRTPIVLDCSAIDADKLDLQAYCQRMRLNGMLPIAIQGGNEWLNTVAQAQGLALLHASSNHDKPLTLESEDSQALQAATGVVRPKLVSSPVRSGQQVVSKGGDLIITAAVSHGAELLADGHIHVYGALRGRALAGIAGDRNARIFCQSLDAELVAIAGFYRLSDAMEPISRPCQIFLQDDHIQIEPL